MGKQKLCKAKTAKGTRCTRAPRHEGLCKQHAKTGKPTGRRTVLNEEIHRGLVTALQAGSTIADAVMVVGVSQTAYFSWMERGEADLEQGKATPFAEFAQDATRARAAARVGAVGKIRSAMSEDWRAAAWFLERSDPENWGRRDRVRTELSGPNGEPINFALEGEALINDDEAREHAAALRRRLGSYREKQSGRAGTRD